MSSDFHKAIAIPVIYTDDGDLKFLIVKDKRFKEWTFVSGGCRKREMFNPIRCALRELEEETRGILNLKRGTYNYFKFTNRFESLDDDSIYHVYIFYINISSDDMKNIVEKFNEEKLKMDTNQVAFRKNYDENDKLEFVTLNDLKSKTDVWRMVSEKILDNPDFYKALYSSKTKNFYVVY